MDTQKILKAAEVLDLTGLSRATLWRMERRGEFPNRIRLTHSRVGWKLTEVNQWLEERPRVIGRKV